MLIRLLGYQWLGIGLQGLISLALGILVARSFGPEMFGVYSVALSTGLFLGVLIDGGFGNLLQRETARATPDIGFDNIFLPSYAIGHALVAIAGLIVIVLVAPIPFHHITLVFAIFAFGSAVIGLFFQSILRGQGRLVSDALWQLANRGLTAICILMVLWWGANQPWEILAAQFFGAAILVGYLIRLQRVKPILPVPLQVYRTALPMLWLNLVSVIYGRADMILLKLLEVPRSDIGYYSVAYRIMETFLLLATPVGLMLFRYFRLNESGNAITLKSVLRPAGIGSLIGLAIVGACTAVGDYVIVTAFGQPFAPAAALLMILAVSLIAAFAKGILLQAAMAFGLERWCAIATTVAAFVNVSANLLLLPSYGVEAAAWIMVATETVIGLLILYGLSWHRQSWETLQNEG